MDPRLLSAIQSLLENAPLFPRCEMPAYGRLCDEDTVELVLPDRLDCSHAESYFVDLRTNEPVGPTWSSMCWPPPPETGFVDVTILLERAEDDATD